MKAETKAKRRVTLSIAGLGWLDESETSSIKSAAVVDVDTETGEIADGGREKFRQGIKGTAEEIKAWQDAAWNEAETPQEPPPELKRAKAAPFD